MASSVWSTPCRRVGCEAGNLGSLWIVVAFVAADNLLWRVASCEQCFRQGDRRLEVDFFRHLTGHAQSYFADRMPGMLTSRVTATSNAVFQIENMFVWNVLPPCVATVGAIAFLAMVSVKMTAALVVVAAIVMAVMFRFAAAGRPLHHEFANKAAAVDGEMVDVIGNMPLVERSADAPRASPLRCDRRRGDEGASVEPALSREVARHPRACRRRDDALLIGLGNRAVAAAGHGRGRRAGLHAGLSVLSATRDLAVALVDVTQHMARLAEALTTLLSPHELKIIPKASVLGPTAPA